MLRMRGETMALGAAVLTQQRGPSRQRSEAAPRPARVVPQVACDLELWGEAFRSVEDIQALIALGKKPPKQQMMATYYAKLTQIFARSESHLYHAYAWLKLFNFSKSYNKNLAPADLQMMACSVLLATLSILPYERADVKHDDNSSEQDRDRIVRMATILGFSVVSPRSLPPAAAHRYRTPPSSYCPALHLHTLYCKYGGPRVH
jgi:hypothetical protein